MQILLFQFATGLVLFVSVKGIAIVGCFSTPEHRVEFLCRAFVSAGPPNVSIGGHTTVSPRLGL